MGLFQVDLQEEPQPLPRAFTAANDWAFLGEGQEGLG